MSAEGGVFMSTSGVSAFTGEPFVVVRWGENAGQLTPGQARDLAVHVLACADAAESDAAVAKRLRSSGYTDDEIAAFLADVRDLRSLS